jgi:hypothetical protein
VGHDHPIVSSALILSRQARCQLEHSGRNLTGIAGFQADIAAGVVLP